MGLTRLKSPLLKGKQLNKYRKHSEYWKNSLACFFVIDVSTIYIGGLPITDMWGPNLDRPHMSVTHTWLLQRISLRFGSDVTYEYKITALERLLSRNSYSAAADASALLLRIRAPHDRFSSESSAMLLLSSSATWSSQHLLQQDLSSCSCASTWIAGL